MRGDSDSGTVERMIMIFSSLMDDPFTSLPSERYSNARVVFFSMPWRARIRKDVLVLLLVSIIVFCISAAFNVFGLVISLIQAHNSWLMDDLLTVSIILTFGLSVFSYRRYLEISQAMRERQRAESALREANRKLNLMNGITRHDILNQLTVVKGCIGLLEKAAGGPEEREYLNHLTGAVDRIQKQIAFTQYYQEIGIHAPEWQDVDATIMKARLGLDTGRVAIETDDIRVEIYADPLLERVFFNLLQNALEHGGPTLSRIHFSMTETPDGLLLACEDDGIGIPLEKKGKLLKGEFREIVGYGLYLVKDILSITGISLKETGRPGGGARFEMLIPREDYRFTKVSGT
jgi:signal transduction histidine kinase